MIYDKQFLNKVLLIYIIFIKLYSKKLILIKQYEKKKMEISKFLKTDFISTIEVLK